MEESEVEGHTPAAGKKLQDYVSNQAPEVGSDTNHLEHSEKNQLKDHPTLGHIGDSTYDQPLLELPPAISIFTENKSVILDCMLLYLWFLRVF